MLCRLLFFIGLFSTTFCKGQTLEELETIVNKYYNAEEYDSAIVYSEKIIITAKDDSTRSQWHSNMGLLHGKAGHIKKAEAEYKTALSIQINSFGKQSSQYTNSLNTLARFYRNMNMADEAEPLLLEAAEIEKKISGETNIRYVIALQRLSSLYNDKKDWVKSEYFLVQAFNIIKNQSSDNLETYTDIVTNLASLCENKTDYVNAEVYYKTALDGEKKLTGDTSLNYAMLLYNLGNLYTKIYRLQDAEIVQLQSLSIKSRLLTETDPSYLRSLYNLSVIYNNKNDYKTQLYYLLKILQLEESASGKKQIQYLIALNDLAKNYDYRELFDSSKIAFTLLLSLAPEVIDTASLVFSNYLSNYGSMLISAGDYKGAKQMLLSALNIADADSSSESFTNISNNLAMVYIHQEDYEKAKQLLYKGLRIIEKRDGKMSINYAFSLHNLAAALKEMENFNEAEKMYKEEMAIRKSITGDKSFGYANSINSLAVFYSEQSKNVLAEPLFLENLSIVEKVLGKENTDYARALQNLGYTYQELGQEKKAKEYLENATLLFSKVVGSSHPFYITSLGLLGAFYMNAGYYSDAKSLLKQAVQISSSIFGEKSKGYLDNLTMLGRLYRRMHIYDTAQVILEKSVALEADISGKNSSRYSNTLTYLASLYDNQGKLNLSDSINIIAAQLDSINISTRAYGYGVSMINLGATKMRLKQWPQAEAALLKGNHIILNNLLQTFAVLGEEEKNIFIEKQFYNFAFINSLFLQNPAASDSAKIAMFNQQLRLKSLSLADTRMVMEKLYTSTNVNIIKKVKDWQVSKTFLGKQYSLPSSARNISLDSLEDAVLMMEKELTRIATSINKEDKQAPSTFTQIKTNLLKDEAAVEFVRFQYYNTSGWTDSFYYAAYIVRKDKQAPEFVMLTEEKPLAALFKSSGNTNNLIQNLYRGAGSDENITTTKGDSLYRLIWQPLEKYLQGITKINYAPVGKLYPIAFNALPMADSILLTDKYELHQYTNIGLLANRNKIASGKPATAVLFGDAQFDAETKGENAIVINRNTYTQNRGNVANKWASLPGTADEVKKLETLFKNNKINTRVFTKAESTEEVLKSLSGTSPQVLHLATHGFFLPLTVLEPGDEKKNNYASATNPLMRSGLVLAGGNYAWSGKFSVAGKEDGIVTAFEISQLDLSKTELVVLSACETALGDVQGAEGVFGLQRAFKLAGVNKLVVSLWQVPDKETAELMITFYSNWLGGKTIEDAFYTAQSLMRKKYAPFYWAAFVLIE